MGHGWSVQRAAVAALTAGALAAAGCGHGDPGAGTASVKAAPEAAVNFSGKHITLQTSVAKGEQRVHIKVVSTKSRSTVALVPVYVNGRGPYAFALDTGASKSLIDTRLAHELGLKSLGKTPKLHGVAGSARGDRIRVLKWRAGGVTLHPETITSLPLAGDKGTGEAGLLGSDVLSRYGKIAIDYDHDLLLLDPRVK